MKILIVNYNMQAFYGGTQTWTMTMVDAFRELGHDVHFTGHNFKINKLFEEKYQPLYKKYNLVIINGNVNISKFNDMGEKSVFVSHGIIPKLEQPISGTDYILAVSEEVEENIKNKGFQCNGIVRNPINTDHFHFTNINKKLQTIGVVDRRRHFIFLKNMKRKYNVKEIGFPPTNDIKSAIADCDLIVGKGRVAYEAMSMGKAVIISGNNDNTSGKFDVMDGYIDISSFYEFRKNNCSGRHNNIVLNDFEKLKKEINKYNMYQGILNRNLIIKNNNYLEIGKQILSIIK